MGAFGHGPMDNDTAMDMAGLFDEFLASEPYGYNMRLWFQRNEIPVVGRTLIDRGGPLGFPKYTVGMAMGFLQGNLMRDLPLVGSTDAEQCAVGALALIGCMTAIQTPKIEIPAHKIAYWESKLALHPIEGWRNTELRMEARSEVITAIRKQRLPQFHFDNKPGNDQI